MLVSIQLVNDQIVRLDISGVLCWNLRFFI